MPKYRAPRAQQFQPYDALVGFRELLKEKERIIVPRKELSEDDYEMLDLTIKQVAPGMMIRIVYFDHGQYIQLEGVVTKINLENRVIQIVKEKIDLKLIIEIEIL